MLRRPETQLDGSLYELVARGEKDKFFFKDDEKSVNPFDYRYKMFPATLPEVRHTNALNAIRWGSMVEWEFDFPGDVLQEAKLVATLPTWLPPTVAPLNGTSIIEDVNGVRYGYVNGIGYFLYKKIQLYQDNILIQEISGDALYALSRTKGSWNGGYLRDRLAGLHDGTPLSVQRSATPPELRLDLPFPGIMGGDQGGFPICSTRYQQYRLKVWLRPLEELVVATNEEPYPQPWDTTMYLQRSEGDPLTSFQTLSRLEIPMPQIVLETRQLYLSNEERVAMFKDEYVIPFRRYFENEFTFNDKDYAPLVRQALAQSFQRLDADFLAERVVSFFRNRKNLRANLWNRFEQDLPNTAWFNNMKLIIAGQDREFQWPQAVWRYVTQFAKEERSTTKDLAIMNWSIGYRLEDPIPNDKEPTGGINFTEADRPNLYIDLVDVPPDPLSGGRNVELRSIVESWALFEVTQGKGRFKFAN